MTIRTGIVVPTLGTRPDYLIECLQSIREAGDCFVLLVAPNDTTITEELPANLFDAILIDPGQGLAAAINAGVAALPLECIFATWLGDDDRLISNSLAISEKALSSDGNISAIFGVCEYIDENGAVFWENKLGRLAIPLLGVGPNRIPQPGSVFRRHHFDSIGGLDTTLGWAFDQDMFTRLNRIGRLKFINRTLAQFRWHASSLSAGSSEASVREASKVRFKHSRGLIRVFLLLAEPVHVQFALRLGSSLNKRKEIS